MNISVAYDNGYIAISSLYLVISPDCDINAACNTGVSSFYAICDVDQITDGCQLNTIIEIMVHTANHNLYYY